MRKFYHAAFAVEEKEVFCICDREGGIGFFGTGGDFGADGANEDLVEDVRVSGWLGQK